MFGNYRTRSDLVFVLRIPLVEPQICTVFQLTPTRFVKLNFWRTFGVSQKAVEVHLSIAKVTTCKN